MDMLNFRFVKNNKVVKIGQLDKLSLLHFAISKDIDTIEIGFFSYGCSNTPSKFICTEKIYKDNILTEFERTNKFCKKVYGISY